VGSEIETDVAERCFVARPAGGASSNVLPGKSSCITSRPSTAVESRSLRLVRVSNSCCMAKEKTEAVYGA
jgi:hypothetical protein